MNEYQEHTCYPKKITFKDHFKKYYYSFLLWVYVYIWCRYCYGHVMRLLHKFNLHYAPPVYMDPFFMKKSEQNNPYKQHWCQWCGLRGDVWNSKIKLDVSDNIV
jgi:hypothetical protein